MLVEELMTKGLISVDINENCSEVAKIMESENIGFVGVLENNELVGVLTDRDLVIKALVNNDNTVTNSTTKNVITIDKNDTVDNALQLMGSSRVKRIIVMDNNNPAGVVSLSDILNSDYTSTISRAVSQIYSID